MAEQISQEVSIGTYQLFYVYLYLGSLLFLVFVYVDVMRTKGSSVVSKKTIRTSVNKNTNLNKSENASIPPSRLESQFGNQSRISTLANQSCNEAENDNFGDLSSIAEKIPKIPRPRVHYGSFYLRVGCVCKYKRL